MMSRLCRHIDKVFHFGRAVGDLRDSRAKPQIRASAIFAGALAMLAMRRGSLTAMDVELRLPKGLDGFIGPRKPSADRIGDVFACVDSEPLRRMLSDIAHRLGRNKVLQSPCPLAARWHPRPP